MFWSEARAPNGVRSQVTATAQSLTLSVQLDIAGSVVCVAKELGVLSAEAWFDEQNKLDVSAWATTSTCHALSGSSPTQTP